MNLDAGSTLGWHAHWEQIFDPMEVRLHVMVPHADGRMVLIDGGTDRLVVPDGVAASRCFARFRDLDIGAAQAIVQASVSIGETDRRGELRAVREWLAAEQARVDRFIDAPARALEMALSPVRVVDMGDPTPMSMPPPTGGRPGG